MESVYGVGLTGGEIERLKQESLAYPPTEWEILRDRRIAEIQGNSNPFVGG
ncbi:Endonuclease I [Candidatus Thiomargarita nelsonii]|uniref:Endonuclease I n=1 Tax=Candidatus Thiomargarita nelsonii TaxID=1003181 RepID=A0A176S4N7_9GAMM|nr:Endonuclease I [Candidatus Thiomargarita nelsonii]